MNLEKIIAVRKGKTVYKDGDNCIKIFNEDYSKADILNEALNQARVEELPINVPKIKAVTKIDEKWAIVTEYIEGKTLAQLMTENSDKIDEYLEKFIDLQLQVQSNTSPLLTKLKEKFIKKIYLAEVDPNLKYDLHTRLDSMAKGYSVCHGDFNPSNIIIGENGKTYIIDWGHATQGNPCADVARTYLLFCLAGDKATAEKYMNLYCIKSKKDKKDVQRWLPIVAVSQSVKGNKEERDLLLTWANVMDFE